jgi:hypothetical protein
MIPPFLRPDKQIVQDLQGTLAVSLMLSFISSPDTCPETQVSGDWRQSDFFSW